jgi:hypothetical protein
MQALKKARLQLGSTHAREGMSSAIPRPHQTNTANNTAIVAASRGKQKNVIFLAAQIKKFLNNHGSPGWKAEIKKDNPRVDFSYRSRSNMVFAYCRGMCFRARAARAKQ